MTRGLTARSSLEATDFPMSPLAARMTAPSVNANVSKALTAISDIAARLSRGGDVPIRITDVLELLRSALEAEDVALWLNGGTGLIGIASSGSAVTTPAEVAARLDRSSANGALHVRPLVLRGERLGAISLRRPRPLSETEATLFSTVANLLAPDLHHADQQHRLVEELERRTRQVEDERRLTAHIIDSLPVGLYVIDREYRVCAWNRNRETGYQGVSRENAIGKSIFEVLHRQPEASLRKEFDEVFVSGKIQQFNIESSASGHPRTFRVTKVPMSLLPGRVTHVIAIGEDITEWASAQDRFAQSEKLAAIGQLAAGVMHEVNNPLATIAACAESLSHRLQDLRAAGCDVPALADEFTRLIESEVQRCKRIVDGLLDFSRPRSATLEPCDLNVIVGQTVFLLKHHAKFKRIRVQTLCDSDLDRIMGNSEQLIQVFMALLLNAADALSGIGTITVRTRRGLSQAEGVIAEVIDEGHGIARHDLSRIFEPFYSTKEPGRGTGLGLSICYSIIAAHGGRIDVDSALGAGSTFRVVLPAAVGA